MEAENTINEYETGKIDTSKVRDRYNYLVEQVRKFEQLHSSDFDENTVKDDEKKLESLGELGWIK